MAVANVSNLETLIQAIETADSKAAMVLAVRQLAVAQDPNAIPTLIKVLGYNNPGAAVAAVDGLVALGEVAVPTLLQDIDGYNYGARAWAIRALALIGDPRALPVLLDTAAGDFALSVRRAAARGIGSVRWEKLPAEQRVTAQAKVMAVLMQTTADPEWVVRYAAVAGLANLAQNLDAVHTTNPKARIQEHLKQVCDRDETPAVCARAYLALEQIAAA